MYVNVYVSRALSHTQVVVTPLAGAIESTSTPDAKPVSVNT